MEVRSAISEVISSSPLAMLDEHVKACAKCVAKLPDYFDAAQAGKWAKAAKVQAEIVDLEGKVHHFFPERTSTNLRWH